MNGEWMKKRDWKVSHFVRDDERIEWMGRVTGRAACGSCVSIDGALKLDSQARHCDRCERRLVNRYTAVPA